MQNTLFEYIPQSAKPLIQDLINTDNLVVKIKGERKTRHGDYTKLPNGKHQITVNSNLNPFRFLITLIHEIAHLVAFKKFGRNIKPHGRHWKFTFQQLMLPFINPQVFPSQLLPLLALHFKNPKASSDTDARLSLALKHFDPENDKNYIFEIPDGGVFRLYNGKLFKRGAKRVKRYECVEISTGKIYLFQPNAEVEFIK